MTSHSLPRAPLSRASVAREAFAAAQQITSEWSRSRAVRQMAGLLPPDCLPAALTLARTLVSPTLRARTLMALALATAPDDRPALLAEAEQVIHTIPSAAARAGPLSVLAERLGGSAGAEAAQAALAGAPDEADPNERGWLIVGLLPHLPEPARLTALAQLRSINDAGLRAPMLAHAARHLPETHRPALLADALAQARAIDEAETRAGALSGLLPTLPPAERAAVAAEALAAAATLNDDTQWGHVARWTAASLPPENLAAAYSVARALGPVEARAEALSALALVAPEANRPARLAEALQAAAQVPGGWDRAFAVEPLAGVLPPELYDLALSIGRTIADDWARSDVLAELSVNMPPDLKAAVLQEALAAARAATQPWPRARALTGVAAQLD